MAYFYITVLFQFYNLLSPLDEVGAFRWRSARPKAGLGPDKQLRFIKEYERHEVYYSGVFEGGLFYGRWSLEGAYSDDGGTFALWPENINELQNLRLQYKDKECVW